MNNKLIVSPSPHVHSGDIIEKNMYGVLIALIPAFLVAIYVFRLDALIITALSVLFCVGFEYLIARFILKTEPSVFDGSAIITGVLLAFNVPSNLPVWILALGALFIREIVAAAVFAFREKFRVFALRTTIMRRKRIDLGDSGHRCHQA